MTKKLTYNYRFINLNNQIRGKIKLGEFTYEEFLDIVECTFGNYNSNQELNYYIQFKKSLLKHKFELFCDLLASKGGFPVNKRFIEFGIGNPLGEITNSFPTNGRIIELWQRNLVITRYSAVASSSHNIDTPFHISSDSKSWLNNIDAIIEVEGDSMADKIFEGDELFCKKIINEYKYADKFMFKNDKTIYILQVKGYGNPMIKYVEHKNGSSEVTLISENQAHQPFTINLNDIESVSEVIRVVRNPKNL